jgi:hypothetical protein
MLSLWHNYDLQTLFLADSCFLILYIFDNSIVTCHVTKIGSQLFDLVGTIWLCRFFSCSNMLHARRKYVTVVLEIMLSKETSPCIPSG